MKIRLYGSGVISILRYGSDGYNFRKKVRSRINHFNSKCLSTITRRTIEEEASEPTVDIIAKIYETRGKWLGHILRMDESRPVHKAVRESFERGKQREGALIEMAPKVDNFNELVRLAKNRKEWRKCVRSKADSSTPVVAKRHNLRSSSTRNRESNQSRDG